ncbi:hypothetical protein [Streptomyces sp. NPDC048350]|uniref:hypothetical protein n=1 Tax=Streptomyces sp. NPDC048350 TaxID=3365538 RepID=UPI00371B72C6
MGSSDEILGNPQVLVVFDWRDGAVEGILGSAERASCWYFKLFAERMEGDGPDDRIFGLWRIPEAAAAVFLREFVSSGKGGLVWPVAGGLGSAEAQRLVEQILSVEHGVPRLIVRTPDFPEVLGVWDVTAN